MRPKTNKCTFGLSVEHSRIEKTIVGPTTEWKLKKLIVNGPTTVRKLKVIVPKKRFRIYTQIANSLF